ncbi:TetR family transcriptional regulator [Arsenicicoccus sp. oral taxon 190]|uniref:TetR family transcriptional regulator n=1 Tax=Arsenicicoccus sp. oral taxon 190 TaxID=1658671 RepID=UPI000679F0AB|nr:TetR family transcriptional regulator [Arsenicicoccus sp. oral taxon 190]AKT50645.1 hypothetical protein ADJ73_03780 [Arsenicicoccus sp. oral taxon 190]
MQTRRDLAKAETRAALADAAIEIARVDGVDSLTADAIAQRAGVSRRTFFNYFPTTDAVLAVPSGDFMCVALEEFERRPAGEPLTDSIIAALTAADPGTLARFASVVMLCEGQISAERVERAAWDEAEGDIARALAARLPEGTPALHLAVLSSCVVAAGRSAVLAWVAGSSDLAGPDAARSLRGYLIDAFGYLTESFAGATVRPHDR